MIHGAGRNGRSYYRSVHDAATSAGLIGETIIIAPHFLTEEDVDTHSPGAAVPFWTDNGWKQGDESLSTTNNPRPATLSSFAVADHIMARLADPAFFPNLRTVVLAGHSAGGQYVNRFAAANIEPVQTFYVVANPSSYLYLDDRRRWFQGATQFVGQAVHSLCMTYNWYKYGLDVLNPYMQAIGANTIVSRYRDRHVTYLLGLDDNDPNHDELDKSCQAMLQGDHRLERGTLYFNYLQQFYGPSILGTQRVVEVPGVGHSGHDMFTSPEGVQELFPPLPITEPPLPPLPPQLPDPDFLYGCASLLLHDDHRTKSPTDTISHHPGALLAGTTCHGSIKLAEAASGQDRTIRFTTDSPQLVAMPGVRIPAGEATGQFSIQVAAAAAGRAIAVTAHGDIARQGKLVVPTRGIRTTSVGTRPGYQSTVLGIAPYGHLVYATQYFGIAGTHESPSVGHLVGLDAASMTEIVRTPVGYQPRSVAVNPVLRRAYVVNYGSKSYSLTVLDCTTPNAPTFVTELPLGQVPIDVAVNARTNHVYVTNPTQRKIHVIDGATNTPLTAIDVGAGLGGIAVDEDTNTIYVARTHRTPQSELRALTVIQARADGGFDVQAPIDVGVTGSQPADVAVIGPANRLYVACLGAPSAPPGIAVLDRTTGEPVAFIRTIANPHAISVDPNRNQLHAGTDAGLQTINAATNTTISTVPTTAAWSVGTYPAIGTIYYGSAISGLVGEVPAPDVRTTLAWH